MYLFITILIVIAAALLILAVLIQNPKGGGLASNFSSSNNIMGVARTNDVIEKVTWGLAIAILVLALVSNLAKPSVMTGAPGTQSIMQQQIDDASMPADPNAVPQQQQQAQPQGQGADGAPAGAAPAAPQDGAATGQPGTSTNP